MSYNILIPRNIEPGFNISQGLKYYMTPVLKFLLLKKKYPSLPALPHLIPVWKIYIALNEWPPRSTVSQTRYTNVLNTRPEGRGPATPIHFSGCPPHCHGFHCETPLSFLVSQIFWQFLVYITLVMSLKQKENVLFSQDSEFLIINCWI